ncbi:MAG: CARDB domain-containing protein [Acidobacteriota bacterium]
MTPRRDPQSIQLMLFFTALMLTTLVILWPASAHPDEVAGSSLRLTQVSVTPEEPQEDTLCALQVTLANDGEQAVSAFAFRVTVDGVELPAYSNRIFFQPLAAGQEATLELYNFWATESDRPQLRPGGPAVEVELIAARQLSASAGGALALAAPVSPLPAPRRAGSEGPRAAASR